MKETARRTRWLADVTIMPKVGVNDPQGDSVEHGLHALGFVDASEVRVGKVIALSVAANSEQDATNRIAAMCDRLLANPVIESFSISLREHTEDQTGTTIG